MLVLLSLLQVYDVSGFISKHPGGTEQILLGAGRDITYLFEVYHTYGDKYIYKATWPLSVLTTYVTLSLSLPQSSGAVSCGRPGG